MAAYLFQLAVSAGCLFPDIATVQQLKDVYVIHRTSFSSYCHALLQLI